MKKMLLLIAVLISLNGHAQSLRAMPDTFTVLQASVDTFDLTANDSIPVGDSVCISLVGSPSGFSVLNCNSIIFQPDSFFTGRDTIRYVLCDTAGICDTTTVLVNVNPNLALLPVAGFKQDSTLPYLGIGSHYHLFSCQGLYIPECPTYRCVNTSSNFDSIIWQLTSIGPSYCQDSVLYFETDTILINLDLLSQTYHFCYTPHLILRLKAYNRFGVVTISDTSCQIEICEGIAEVPLANIHIYPNPADKVLTIDMRQNNDAISLNYASIYVYDDLGQRVRSIPRHDSSRLVEIPVASLPDGIYLSTITDATGREMMLGRFTVVK